jgi:hypothetical protein
LGRRTAERRASRRSVARMTKATASLTGRESGGPAVDPARGRAGRFGPAARAAI